MRRGFTLIEVVIVVGISVLLTSVVLTYSSSGRDQVYLGIQKAQVAQIISKAKSLTVSTYNQPDVPCGYGVWFDYENANPKYEIFRYKISPCPSFGDLKNSGIVHGVGYEVQSKYTLPPNLKFKIGTPDQIDTIFFMPPDPKTLMWNNGGSEDSGGIYLETRNESASAKVEVNSGGQITF